MNMVMPLLRRSLKSAALAGCWLASVLSLHAQAASTGTVQGRVFNPTSQTYVRNAEVRLEGTSQVTYTENDGSFRFDNVPVGQASVDITFTGYTPVKETFTVTSGQTAVREINLTSTAASSTNKDGVVQ